jgi:uncharacterized protein (TIGR00369 family)
MTPPETDSARRELLEQLNRGFSHYIPHNRALQLELIDYGPGLAWMRLPYADKLVGNAETRVLHGGAISSLLDAACGTAVFMKLGAAGRIATLDLRIDYLKPATPERDVVCKAECFKLTRQVAFVRALAYHDDESDPIAAGAGTFMIFDGARASHGPKS